MNVDEIYAGSGTSLKAEDLKGKDVPLVVQSWEVKEFDEQGQHGPYTAKKIVLSFEKTDRTLVLNKTNGYMIAEELGRQNPDDWVGATIVAFPTKTDFGGKRVDCIRIRSAKLGEGVRVRADVNAPDENEVPF